MLWRIHGRIFGRRTPQAKAQHVILFDKRKPLFVFSKCLFETLCDLADVLLTVSEDNTAAGTDLPET